MLMVSADISTLRIASDWLKAGHCVSLFTVVRTWGSAPRPVGAIAAIRGDGLIEGSVSGGCVEDDLVDRSRSRPDAAALHMPSVLTYGVTRDEAFRFGLPCGGTLELVCEPLTDARWIDELVQRCERHEIVLRELSMRDGSVQLRPGVRGASLSFDGHVLSAAHGPQWRLLLIGAGQLSRYVAQIASTLDFEVFICDPREEYAGEKIIGPHYVDGMPDDAVLALEPDAHTAIVALTHDSKLDDMALLEALKSDAFYVGALGSQRNTETRKQRLALLDLQPDEINRLHGPVGLCIASRTPPEIAVSIMAEIIAVRNSGIRHEPVNIPCVATAMTASPEQATAAERRVA
ncbi:MAG: xanthine and dehydrogenase maturation factor, XdhC/CoxF family [Rhodocyclales bacterium]|nr:xanthine and dehydrogenase maturation factor, XdhC/CoxF family [Rhodocyclales bacterium]